MLRRYSIPGLLLGALILLAAPRAFGQVNKNEFANPILRFADTANATDPLNGAPIPVPEDYPNGPGVVQYYRDFTWWESTGVRTTDTSPINDSQFLFTYVKVAGNTVVTLTTSGSGELALANGTAINDTVTAEALGRPWKYTVGKRLWFFIRFKVDTVNLSAISMGLTTTLSSGDPTVLPSDGIFFVKAAAATDVDFHVRKSSTSTSTTSFTGTAFADNTYRTIGFLIDQQGNVAAYTGANASAAGVGNNWNSMTKAVTVPVGNVNIPTANLELSFGVKNGSAASRTLTIDYIYVATER